jgi:hypothetical protein
MRSIRVVQILLNNLERKAGTLNAGITNDFGVSLSEHRIAKLA